jgi:hypothetical protein
MGDSGEDEVLELNHFLCFECPESACERVAPEPAAPVPYLWIG